MVPTTHINISPSTHQFVFLSLSTPPIPRTRAAMKIYSLMMLRHPAAPGGAASATPADGTTLALATSLDSFGYFERGTVKQFLTFFSKTVATRTPLGQRASVAQKEYMLHAHVRASGLAAVAVCDAEYPSRVAYTLLMKMQEDFCKRYSNDRSWMAADAHLPFEELDAMIKKFQNPHEADAILRIQNDLDETKVVLHNTIESLLERGVKLDNLVERSTDLSANSKMFYTTAKKQNSCCGFA
jgi:synaptobrevin homolog YKT6